MLIYLTFDDGKNAFTLRTYSLIGKACATILLFFLVAEVDVGPFLLSLGVDFLGFFAGFASPFTAASSEIRKRTLVLISMQYHNQ